MRGCCCGRSPRRAILLVADAFTLMPAGFRKSHWRSARGVGRSALKKRWLSMICTQRFGSATMNTGRKRQCLRAWTASCSPSRCKISARSWPLARDAAGRLYVADSAAGQIKIYDTTGNKAQLVRSFALEMVAGGRVGRPFLPACGVASSTPKGYMRHDPDRDGRWRAARPVVLRWQARLGAFWLRVRLARQLRGP